jgi:hypothetical protein
VLPMCLYRPDANTRNANSSPKENHDYSKQ